MNHGDEIVSDEFTHSGNQYYSYYFFSVTFMLSRSAAALFLILPAF